MAKSIQGKKESKQLRSNSKTVVLKYTFFSFVPFQSYANMCSLSLHHNLIRCLFKFQDKSKKGFDPGKSYLILITFDLCEGEAGNCILPNFLNYCQENINFALHLIIANRRYTYSDLRGRIFMA